MNIFSVYGAYTEKKTENYKVPFGNQQKCSFPTGDNVEGRPIINKNSVCAAKVNKKPGPTVIALAVLFSSSFTIIVVFVVVFTSYCCYRHWKNCAKVKTSKETSKETSNEQIPLVPNASNN